MAWEKRGEQRYYYRARWDGRRCIKQYLGRGPAAEAAAQEDEAKRTGRVAQRFAAEVEKALEKPARALLSELDGQVRIAIQTALTAAGFRQHARGRWRKRRAATTKEKK
jgi:hypothetical protein